ncbi:hypothetical protein C8R45DRAFT_1005638 [Mycena sanguinolenta]|nr:hypothetical protein C8R45DRAFT_1005638 [Mycena sanguinolenta]
MYHVHGHDAREVRALFSPLPLAFFRGASSRLGRRFSFRGSRLWKECCRARDWCRVGEEVLLRGCEAWENSESLRGVRGLRRPRFLHVFRKLLLVQASWLRHPPIPPIVSSWGACPPTVHPARVLIHTSVFLCVGKFDVSCTSSPTAEIACLNFFLFDAFVHPRLRVLCPYHRRRSGSGTCGAAPTCLCRCMHARALYIGAAHLRASSLSFVCALCFATLRSGWRCFQKNAAARRCTSVRLIFLLRRFCFRFLWQENLGSEEKEGAAAAEEHRQ